MDPQTSWLCSVASVEEVGPQRVYPGGLAVARSIGDVLLKSRCSGAVVASADVFEVELADDAWALVLARYAPARWGGVHVRVWWRALTQTDASCWWRAPVTGSGTT